MARNPQYSLVHVDVDNLWIQKEEFGISDALDLDVIYTEALRRALGLFKRNRIRATFFIVGKDLERKSCQEFCKAAVADGHELGNHSYSHKSTFASLNYDDMLTEIKECDQALQSLSGKKPLYFRSPGYYLSKEIYQILSDLSYKYDSSLMPGVYTTALSLYMKLAGKSDLNKKIGNISNILGTRKAFVAGELMELPIYTTPWLKLPTHSSILFMLGEAYSKYVLRVLSNEQLPITYIFHAVDWLDERYAPFLKAKLPCFRYTLELRERLTDQILQILSLKNNQIYPSLPNNA